MRFDVWLVSFAPGKAPARALAQTYGIDMQEALTLELTLPTIVARDLSEGASARAVLELRAIGGRAEARPADPNAPLGFDLPFTVSDWDDEPAAESDNAVDVIPPSKVRSAVRRDDPVKATKEETPLPKVIRPKREDATPSWKDPDFDTPAQDEPDEFFADEENDLPADMDSLPPKAAAKLRPPAALQIADVPRRAPRRTGNTQAAAVGRSSAVTASSSFDLGRFAPALGAMVVALVALYFTLQRGQSALLGSADWLGLALDALALGGALSALIFLGVALLTQRSFLEGGPFVLLLLAAAGGAYGIDRARKPALDAQSEIGDEAAGLIERDGVHLAGLDDASAHGLIDAIDDAGAISIRGAAPVQLMGATVYHGLAIELPPGSAARSRIGQAFQAAMTLSGKTNTAQPPPEGELWLVAL